MVGLASGALILTPLPVIDMIAAAAVNAQNGNRNSKNIWS